MNPTLLATWISLIFGVLTIVLLIAHLLTGRKHKALQAAVGVSAIVGLLGFAYWRYLG
ncbi:MAG: hypothetical protein ACFBSD_13340 [Paracoccaceae bacterium]